MFSISSESLSPDFVLTDFFRTFETIILTQTKFMITVLLIMLTGILTGFAINKYPLAIKVNDKLISWAIYVLLFLLGISVGLNKTILQNLDKIGVQALIITVGAISGSVLALWILYRVLFREDSEKGGQNEK
jgi:uncharacterized membrane protein YbjE (DUF340 family)